MQPLWQFLIQPGRLFVQISAGKKLIDPGDVSDHKVWLLKNTLTQSNN